MPTANPIDAGVRCTCSKEIYDPVFQNSSVQFKPIATGA